MSGLHTLVEGLAITSPVSPTPSGSQNIFSGSPPPSYGGQDTEYTDSGANTPNNVSSSSAPVPRLHSLPLPSRRINYGMSSPGGSPSRKDSSLVSKTIDDLNLLTPGDRLSLRSPGSASPMLSNGIAQKPLAYKGSDYLRLEDFLYTRGFLEGACSDVVVVAFGRQYKLHRLILDRSPYFSCLFNGPWVETSSSEITINPQDSDSNITKEAFELALSRLYGHVDRAAEDAHALALLASACYLDLQDLAESCVNSILCGMTTENIAQTIRFVTASYYGNHGDRILGSAKALLYRDGFEMPPAAWDGISGDIISEIAGYDGFYVPSELHRYLFVKDMLNHRLSQLQAFKSRARVGEYSGKGKGKTLGTRDSEESLVIVSDDSEAAREEDIRPLKELLETGIYYIHLSFEELQRISEDYDVMGNRVVSEATIRSALWQQMLLRQKVVNAPHSLPELGITNTVPLPSGFSLEELEEEARKSVGGAPIYLVPTEDSTTIIAGDHTDGHGSNSRNSGLKNSLSDATATLRLDTDDVSTPREETYDPKEIRYSTFPPFRFSAEFRSIKTLREKKRVYSKTVFYAGSHWNIYIQKVKPGKSVQLGVYLHRAKERDPNEAQHLAVNASSDLPINQNTDFGLHSVRNSTQYHGDAGEEDGSSGGEAHLSNTTQPNTSAPRWASGTGTAQANPNASSPVPTVATYTDSRPMIQTYFKIFSPSKKGKVLSMFSSEPDSFNFSQSWGWKSSTLILDEAGGLESEEGKLRFMVVLGNV